MTQFKSAPLKSPKNKRSKAVFLGIDQGSSSTKAILLDRNLRVIWQTASEVKTKYKPGGIAIQSAQKLYLSVLSCLEQAIAFASTRNYKISAMGLSTQRSAVCVWYKDNLKPATPVFTWQDSSSEEHLGQLDLDPKQVRKVTGLSCFANYAGPKISKLINTKFADTSKVIIGTLDQFLRHKLTGNILAEDTMAARTLLYDLQSRNWSEALCKDFKVPVTLLSKIQTSQGEYGQFLNIPILASIADAQAAALSLPCTKNQGILNIGTITSLIIRTGKKIVIDKAAASSLLFTSSLKSEGNKRKFQTTLQHRQSSIRDFEYICEYVFNHSGLSLELATKKLKLARTLEEASLLCSNLAKRNKQQAIIFMTLSGLKGDSKGRLLLKREFAYGDGLLKALVDHVAFSIAELLKCSSRKCKLKRNIPILCGGGLARMDYLLQKISDISGFKILRVNDLNLSAKGAAILAMQKALSLNKSEIWSCHGQGKCFYPDTTKVDLNFVAWRKLKRLSQNKNLKQELLWNMQKFSI